MDRRTTFRSSIMMRRDSVRQLDCERNDIIHYEHPAIQTNKCLVCGGSDSQHHIVVASVKVSVVYRRVGDGCFGDYSKSGRWSMWGLCMETIVLLCSITSYNENGRNTVNNHDCIYMAYDSN